MINWRQWFVVSWPSRERRRVVLHGYEVLAAHPLTLTDIALRNGVYTEPAPAASEYQAGYAAGRRAAALEILKLAARPPHELYGFVETVKNQPNGD